ncbi:MAG TPA: THUMP domain-containing protein, partial [Burkholderiales bacterium]|nr:THUMP domain-containing protein [Burkholderiales bacterium]
MEHFFAPCPRGLEAVLAQELAALGAADIEVTDGGAHFTGPLTLCYRANLESRIASRILRRVAVAPYRSEEDIYQATLSLQWPLWFDVGHTIRVNVAALRCPLKSLDFVTLRIKDAICDRFREHGGKRPSVDTEQPDVRIHAFLTSERVTLYLDTTGEPLFKRGWRIATTEAPLRENLAAGILRLTGWTPGEALLDPACGSGTLLVEAALIALDIAPGLRRSFAFEKLKNFDREAWHALRATATQRCKPVTPLGIHGSDLYGDTLKVAQANLEHAGFAGAVTLKQANLLEVNPPAPAG